MTDSQDSALPLVTKWLASATHPCECLPPSPESAALLTQLQITTRSPLGAVVGGTGGVLLDHGFLRVIGSGHARLDRDLVSWNAGRSDGYLLVADDAVGGFFALDGGAFGNEPGSVHYLAPDTLAWEPLGIGFGDFLHWATTDALQTFYASSRWPGWQNEVAEMGANRCMSFYPFLWAREGSVSLSSRKPVDVAEHYAFTLSTAMQLKG